MNSLDRERVINCCLLLGGAAAVLRGPASSGPPLDPRLADLCAQISTLCAAASGLADELSQERPARPYLVPAAD